MCDCFSKGLLYIKAFLYSLSLIAWPCPHNLTLKGMFTAIQESKVLVQRMERKIGPAKGCERQWSFHEEHIPNNSFFQRVHQRSLVAIANLVHSWLGQNFQCFICYSQHISLSICLLSNHQIVSFKKSVFGKVASLVPGTQ